MAWLRIGDTLHSCPQILALGDLRLPAVGLYLLCYSWAAEHVTGDGIGDLVPVRQARIAHLECPTSFDALVQRLEQVGLVAKRRRQHPQWGECLVFIATSEQAHARTAAELAADRAPKIPADIRLRVLARDGDQCRWCGMTVNPKDTRGGRGRDFDHVDNLGPHTVENLVVACKRCNGKKADGEILGPLLGSPAERGEKPIYDPVHTLPALIAAGLVPARPTDAHTRVARPVDDLRAFRGTAASGDHATTGPNIDQTRPNVDQGAVPVEHRVGTGQVGSGAGRSSRGGRRHQLKGMDL